MTGPQRFGAWRRRWTGARQAAAETCGSAYLCERLTAVEMEPIRAGERTGRPLGPATFLKQLERSPGLTLVKQKPGPKPKHADAEGGENGRYV